MNRKITRRLLVLLLLFTAHYSLPTAKALDVSAVHSGATNPSRCMPTRNKISNPVGHGGLRWTARDVSTPIPDEVLNSPNLEPSRSRSDPGSGALSDAPFPATQAPAVRNSGGQVFNVKTYGAVGDAIEVTDAAITSGQSTLTSAGSSFPATVVGKSVSVRGAGAGGATLRAIVIARPAATTLTLSVKASATVKGEQAVYGTNDVAAFLAARDAAKRAGGGTVFVPAGFYYLNNQIPVDGTVTFKGDGWNERSTLGVASTVGTRLYVGFDTSTADSLFYATAQGVELEDLEFYATQKESTPLTTPWAIYAYRNPSLLAGGDGVKIRRVMIRNLSHGIKITADRPVLNDIYGQPLTIGIDLDGMYDGPKINNVHFWPFWAGTMASHTIASATALKLGRVDGPQITNFFCFAYFKGIDFEESAAGIAPSGSTARAQLVNTYLDNVHYGIYAGGGIDAVATNLVIYNGSGLGDATTGSRGIYLKDGIVARLEITNGDFMGSDLEAIRADSSSGTITWSNVWVRNWNALNNGSSAFYGVLGNTVNPAATNADPENGHGASPFAGTWTLAGIRTPTGATGFTGIGTLFPLNRLQIKGTAVGGETTPDWQLRLSKNFARANGLGAGPGIILAHQADNSFEGVEDTSNQKRAGIAAPAEDAAFSKVVGLGFWTSNTDTAFSEKMRISGRGAVGIGTTAPASLLHLNDATRPALTISDSALSRSRLFRPTTSQVNLAHNASFDGVGWTLDNPAVGGSSVSMGDSVIQFNQWTAGAGYRTTSTPLQISASGIVTLGTPNYAGCTSLTTNASAVLGCNTSTSKYKENFAGFTKGLQAVRLIVPQTFSWQPNAFAADGGKPHLGLIAENLETANPLLVSRRGDGDLQPEPLALHAIQIDAIKTLDARITALEKSFATAQRDLAIYKLLAEAGIKPSECGPPANPFACVREDPKTGLLSLEKRPAPSKK